MGGDEKVTVDKVDHRPDVKSQGDNWGIKLIPVEAHVRDGGIVRSHIRRR